MPIYLITILIGICIYTFYMGYSDGANCIATCIATRAIKPRTAMIIAGITQLIAPLIVVYLLNKTDVAKTVFNMIKFSSLTQVDYKIGFVFLLSALIGALLWSLFCTIINTPSSTSHTLLGGIVGASIALFGWDSISWNLVGFRIILMIFLTPIISIIFAYLSKKLLDVIASRFTRNVKSKFKMAQGFNVGLLAFSISINNVQKSLGIYLLAVTLCMPMTSLIESTMLYIVLLFSVMILLGLFLGGYRLIYALGTKIYRLNTLGSYCAQTSSAVVSIGCSFIGLPLSIGQVVTSSIIGVGIANNLSAVRWIRAKKIVVGWILTFPLACLLGAGVGRLILLFI